MHQFKAEHWLPITLQEAWAFFSSPHNLSKITPPKLDFVVLSDTKKDAEIQEGMLINYTVRPLLGIKVGWITKIERIVPNHAFTDTQLKGPYKTWEHTHTFMEQNGGVLMQDVINYELPMGFLGEIAHNLLVRKKIEAIFDFRKKTLNQLFQ